MITYYTTSGSSAFNSVEESQETFYSDQDSSATAVGYYGIYKTNQFWQESSVTRTSYTNRNAFTYYASWDTDGTAPSYYTLTESYTFQADYFLNLTLQSSSSSSSITYQSFDSTYTDIGGVPYLSTTIYTLYGNDGTFGISYLTGITSTHAVGSKTTTQAIPKTFETTFAVTQNTITYGTTIDGKPTTSTQFGSYDGKAAIVSSTSSRTTTTFNSILTLTYTQVSQIKNVVTVFERSTQERVFSQTVFPEYTYSELSKVLTEITTKLTFSQKTTFSTTAYYTNVVTTNFSRFGTKQESEIVFSLTDISLSYASFTIYDVSSDSTLENTQSWFGGYDQGKTTVHFETGLFYITSQSLSSNSSGSIVTTSSWVTQGYSTTFTAINMRIYAPSYFWMLGTTTASTGDATPQSSLISFGLDAFTTTQIAYS